MKVQELLSSKDKWTQEAYARDKEGNAVPINSPEAVKWCLRGAIHKCYPNYDVAGAIRSKASIKIKDNIASYNDTHTYEEVMKLVRELDI